MADENIRPRVDRLMSKIREKVRRLLKFSSRPGG
jgi:hypothetical protein